MLAMDSTNLHVVFVSNLIEHLLVFLELRQVDVHGGAQGSTQVGRARRDITEMLIVRELSDSLNMGSSAAKSIEDFSDAGARLHRDDTELVLLIDPNEEGLRIIMEDASAGRPVAVQVARLKETIALLEQEVIIDELLLSCLVHSLERVEGTLEVTIEGLARLNDLVHDLETLLLGDAGAERIAVEVSSDTNTRRVDHLGVLRAEVNILEALGVHVRRVSISLLVTVIVLDDLIEQVAEGGVGIVRASVETDAGVEVLDARENASLEGNTASILVVLILIPDFLGQVLAEQRLGASREERLEVLQIVRLLANIGSLGASRLGRLSSLLLLNRGRSFLLLLLNRSGGLLLFDGSGLLLLNRLGLLLFLLNGFLHLLLRHRLNRLLHHLSTAVA